MNYNEGYSMVLWVVLLMICSNFGYTFDQIHTHQNSHTLYRPYRNAHHQCESYTSCKISTKLRSCLDIYYEDCRNPSGEYVIFHGNQALRVYCSFEKDWRYGTTYGYTFISRRSSGTSVDLRSLYTTSRFAKLRILDIHRSTQREVIVENFSKFSHIDLKFALNGDSRYQRPVHPNHGLHPYLFLGFLDTSLTRNRNFQGYKAAGRDFTFKNCDSNPNSYIAFFFDPNFGSMGRTSEIRPWFMQQWISLSNVTRYPNHMKDEFYMDWEMHMGGCGGFQTSKTINKKGALGMPFAMPSGRCTRPFSEIK